MLDIVIVNYRTANLVIDCLSSLEPEVHQIKDIRIWVVENGSGDDSTNRIAEAIRANRWDWANLKVLDKNLGFAGGNNVAIQEALRASPKSKYVLLLNPDTIVRAGAIQTLLQFMQDRPEVGIAGSRLEHLDGTEQRSAYRFPSWRGEFEEAFRFRWVSKALEKWIVAPPVKNVPHQTDWVCGAAMMIHREVLEAIGLLDDKYFMYYEEVDFCRRAAEAGWPCWYCPQAHIVHLVGQSSGIRPQTNKRRPTYWFAARRYFFLKHYGRLGTLLADIAWAGGYAIFRLRALLIRKPFDDPPWLWWDFVKYNFAFRG